MCLVMDQNKTTKIPLWLMAFLTLVPATITEKATVTINTPLGPVRGIQHTPRAGGQLVTRFLGIPYAQPPVGDLRFQRPQPVDQHQEVLDATTYGASCIPANVADPTEDRIFYDEDCLNLNIFVPGEVQGDAPQLKPVMVYIFGGGYNIGSANERLYDGDLLALEGDVIVVVMNYRLGVFGFLCTGDAAAPGNYALFDQREALRWVQNNIQAYGGDPDNVMLFGESSGAACVGFHLMSPYSEGLFSKAGAHSSNHGGLISTAPTTVLITVAFSLGDDLGCSYEDSTSLLECLRAAPIEDIIGLLEQGAYPSTAVVDFDFIPDDPGFLIESGQFTVVPYLLGSTSEEGTVGIGTNDETFRNGLTAEDVDSIVTQVSVLTGYVINFDEVYDAILDAHFENLIDPFANLRGGLDMYAGVYFIAPMQHMLTYQTEYGGEAYEFYHTARPSFRTNYPNIELGAQHMDELYFVFGALAEGGYLGANSTQKEKDLSKSMMRAWGSFATTGSPVFLDEAGNEQSWPRYGQSDKIYLEFSYGMTVDNIKSDLLPLTDFFWNTLLPLIGES